MIYKLQANQNDLIQNAYDGAMIKLNDFWGINWVINTPNIFIVESRADINKLKGKETESWLVGWASVDNRCIYLLDFEKFDTESSHKKDENSYKALIAHELCHLFVGIIEKKSMPIGPMWWNEGISIYLSGQLKFKKKPEKFTGFIGSNRENPKPAYNEGGYVIELLVNKFGKEKLIEVVKNLKGITSEEEFMKVFQTNFGFELTYDSINNLYLEN